MARKMLTLLLMSLIFMVKGVSVEVDSSKHVNYQISPEQLNWVSIPALPKEIKVAVLYGNPDKDGALVIRIKAPAGSKIAPHWHPIDENITVLSGSINLGKGDKFEKQNNIRLDEGGFANIPAKHHHFAWFDEDSILQLNNYGRWQIIYINPKDDPRNQ
jgi:quercetin dioxygenase-like cupin family protein